MVSGLISRAISMTDVIGFIGLGARGGGMAANIVMAGIKVVAYDILP